MNTKEYIKIPNIKHGVSFPEGTTPIKKDEYVNVCLSIWGSVVRDYDWAVGTEIYKTELKRLLNNGF